MCHGLCAFFDLEYLDNYLAKKYSFSSSIIVVDVRVWDYYSSRVLDVVPLLETRCGGDGSCPAVLIGVQ